MNLITVRGFDKLKENLCLMTALLFCGDWWFSSHPFLGHLEHWSAAMCAGCLKGWMRQMRGIRRGRRYKQGTSDLAGNWWDPWRTSSVRQLLWQQFNQYYWKLKKDSNSRPIHPVEHLSVLSSPLSTEPYYLCQQKPHSVTLTVSSSSSASVSPAVLLKLLVLDEEREMLGLPLLQSFSLINGLQRESDTDSFIYDLILTTIWFHHYALVVIQYYHDIVICPILHFILYIFF